jgi:hypothetical protein
MLAIPTCDWSHPGASPYTGTAESAIMALPRDGRVPGLRARSITKGPNMETVSTPPTLTDVVSGSFWSVEPISLLKGTHADTGTTGQGCFMNVVAYLNGESQITDHSPCVCPYVRPLAICLNDRSTDEQRAQLLPFVLRAMGSATEDAAVMKSRRDRLRKYGQECNDIVQTWRAEIKAKNAYAYADANAYADAYAYAYADAYANADAYASAYAYANAYADADANAYGDAYADANAERLKAQLFDAGLRYLDDVLPASEPVGQVVIQRFEKLVQMQKEAA